MPARATTTTAPTMRGRGEPDPDVARCDPWLTSTIFGAARARWPALDPPPPALLSLPPFAVEVPLSSLPGAVVVVDPLAATAGVAAEPEPPPLPLAEEEGWPEPPEVDAAPATPDAGAVPPVPPADGGDVVGVGPVVVVVVPPAGGAPAGPRSDVGVSVAGGRPVPAPPVTEVPPKTHSVTLPGGGLYEAAPSSL